VGASTISMQVAKNMFLWQERSYVSKAMRSAFDGAVMETGLVEATHYRGQLNVRRNGGRESSADEAAAGPYEAVPFRTSLRHASPERRRAACLAARPAQPDREFGGRPRHRNTCELAAVWKDACAIFGQRGICCQVVVGAAITSWRGAGFCFGATA